MEGQEKYFTACLEEYKTLREESKQTSINMISSMTIGVGIAAVSTVAGSLGWIVGTLGTYSILHLREYKEKQRNFREDMVSFLKSNLEGMLGVWAVRFPLHFSLQEYGGLDTAVAAPISQIVAGQVGTIIRWYRNYQRNIFEGFKSSESKN